ncbi:MAG: S8 family peptidase [Bdellovibrionales bacterium]|nr:S8 family peptidase [Bdellovibrionales bacterium]
MYKRKKGLVGVFLGLLFMLSCTQSEFSKPEKYIVVYKPKQVQVAVQNAGKLKPYAEVVESLSFDLAQRHQLTVKNSFAYALQGSVVLATGDQLKELKLDPLVAYVEKDQKVFMNTSQSSAVWGLDRLDQQSLPLDGGYEYPENNGQGVNVYIIDTGINSTHVEFEGRAHHGYDFVDNDSNATDCNGHGTHVAGTVGGKTYGVAKGVSLFGVRVLDCNGSGSYSDVIAGVEWVTENHVNPAVVNMSLGGPVSQALDDAINNSISAGVNYVVAAGNSNEDACLGSPSRVLRALTVGSVTRSDQRSSFSNYGNCVNIFAPGSDIQSAWYDSNTSTKTISGTSMASPHVAGVVALYLAQNPLAGPEQVRAEVVEGGVANHLTGVGSGSPNVLLNVQFLTMSSENPDQPPPPTPEDPPGEEDLLLSNHAQVEDLHGSKGEFSRYQISVPAGAQNLRIRMDGGMGDADLYVRKGQAPDTESYDCRPYLNGNEESCEIVQPSEGTYYIMIRAYSQFSRVRLRVDYDEPAVEEPPNDPNSPCDDCELVTGHLSAGEKQVLPDLEGVVLRAGVQQLWLKGPADADFDIYLYRKTTSGWVSVASSTSLSSEEKIQYAGDSGIFRLLIHAYKGSGEYKVWYEKP